VAAAGGTSAAASMTQSPRIPQAKMPDTLDAWHHPIGKLLGDPAMRAVQKEFDLSPRRPASAGAPEPGVRGKRAS
jgi:hypothetical protein